jgi:hypothetical protein
MLRFRSRPPRWLALSTFGAATLTAVSCDTSLSFRPNELLWGFVTVSALQDGTGALRTAPTGVFFRGEVTSIPNSGLRPDSCFPPNTYVPPVNNFGGVLYLDAGPSVSMKIGAQTNEIPRVSGSGITTYQLGTGTTVAYGSGDSIIVQVPGATGGYPPATIRGKAAEALTLQPVTPSTSAPIQLRWNTPSDTGSSLVVSLQYAPAGGSGQITREIRCAFKDDGVDSIVVAQHRFWSDTTNVLRQVVATRLRTRLVNVGDGGLQLISTFQYPTPQQ